jgi:hypothetical protein
MENGKQGALSMITFWQQCMGIFKTRVQEPAVGKHKKPVQRKHRRFPLGLSAQYGFNGEKKGECRLCDISAEGMAIQLCPEDTITPSNSLKVYIPLPSQPEPIPVLLQVKWITELDSRDNYTCVAGGVHTFSDAHAQKSLLEYAYTNWFRGIA